MTIPLLEVELSFVRPPKPDEKALANSVLIRRTYRQGEGSLHDFLLDLHEVIKHMQEIIE